MISLFVFAVLISASMAQRGTYSGSRVHGIPDEAYRFKHRNDNTNTNGNAAPGSNLVSRWSGGDNGNRLPVDSTGYVDYNTRFDTWPKENRPFTYVNADAINAHRGGGGTPNQVNGPSFAGNRQVNGGGGRFGESRPAVNTRNSFSVFKNGQRINYDYDPRNDAWVKRY